MILKRNKIEIASRQLSDGSFFCASELDGTVINFFDQRENLVGLEFAQSFSERFCIFDNAIKDRHYKLYQDILFRYRDDIYDSALAECRFFSDPLAESLLLRRSGQEAKPSSFIALDIWDTTYAAWHLLRAGEFDAAEAAVAWLLRQQKPSGGWACSTSYPIEDTDTTAAVILLLRLFSTWPEVAHSADRAFHWIERLSTPDGSIKTFDEAYGVPTTDTTAVCMAARKAWGLSVPTQSLNWLAEESTSHWYSSDSRLRSCKSYLGLTPSSDRRIEPTDWRHDMQRRRFNIRFMGEVWLHSPIWNATSPPSRLRNDGTAIQPIA